MGPAWTKTSAPSSRGGLDPSVKAKISLAPAGGATPAGMIRAVVPTQLRRGSLRPDGTTAAHGRGLGQCRVLCSGGDRRPGSGTGRFLGRIHVPIPGSPGLCSAPGGTDQEALACLACVTHPFGVRFSGSADPCQKPESLWHPVTPLMPFHWSIRPSRQPCNQLN